MKLEQAFEVQAPIEQVWEALIDLERVAPCLPGATITGHDDDGTYHGEFKVKLGPTTAAYRGTVKIEEADAATHTATMRAKGTDKRGQGGANATIVNTLTSDGAGTTRVEAVTDFTITGRLARFGRGGMIEDISNRLMRDFSDLPAEPDRDRARAHRRGDHDRRGAARGRRRRRPGPRIGRRRRAPRHPPPPPPPPAKPISGFSLFFGALWDRIKRLFGANARKVSGTILASEPAADRRLVYAEMPGDLGEPVAMCACRRESDVLAVLEQHVERRSPRRRIREAVLHREWDPGLEQCVVSAGRMPAPDVQQFGDAS